MPRSVRKKVKFVSEITPLLPVDLLRWCLPIIATLKMFCRPRQEPAWHFPELIKMQSRNAMLEILKLIWCFETSKFIFLFSARKHHFEWIFHEPLKRLEASQPYLSTSQWFRIFNWRISPHSSTILCENFNIVSDECFDVKFFLSSCRNDESTWCRTMKESDESLTFRAWFRGGLHVFLGW